MPLTGVACVTRVVTDIGVFDPVGDGFKVIELAPGVSAVDLSGMPIAA